MTSMMLSSGSFQFPVPSSQHEPAGSWKPEPETSISSVCHIRHERELTRTLDRRLQLALVQRTRARDPARLDLPALGQERRQQPDVLVVDVIDLLSAELAHAPAPEETAATSARAVLAL